MITLDNYQKVEKHLPVISQQVDQKATGANIHRIKKSQQLLEASIYFLCNGRDSEYYLTIANEARKKLESFGVHFVI